MKATGDADWPIAMAVSRHSGPRQVNETDALLAKSEALCTSKSFTIHGIDKHKSSSVAGADLATSLEAPRDRP